MTAIDTTRDSLTIVTSFTYRGAPEEYSNTYFMDGTTPASASSWKVLADAVIAQQKLVIDASQSIVRAVGHKAGDSVAVWEYDYAAGSGAVPGTRTTTSQVMQGGDTAVWVRWPTAAKTSKGKPIYLRNYFHPAFSTASTPDAVPSSFTTILANYGAAWLTGFVDGDGTTHHRAGPHGVSAQATATGSTVTTTRTLERRGKRP
jgi:hypothetical protein